LEYFKNNKNSKIGCLKFLKRFLKIENNFRLLQKERKKYRKKKERKNLINHYHDKRPIYVGA